MPFFELIVKCFNCLIVILAIRKQLKRIWSLFPAKNLADRTKHVVNSGKYTLFKWVKSSHNTDYLFVAYFHVTFTFVTKLPLSP